MVIGFYVHIEDEEFVAFKTTIRLHNARFARTDALDLCSQQLNTCCVLIRQKVTESRFSVFDLYRHVRENYNPQRGMRLNLLILYRPSLRMMVRLTLTLLVLGMNVAAQGQTVGLLLNTPEAFDGYTLVAPTGATRTHLVDNCGRIINEWVSNYRAGESAYLLEDGSLLRTCRISSTVFNGGGIGGRIERFSWEGDLIWSYTMANNNRHHHHDMAWLPNGNVVLMGWEYKSAEEAAAVGREIEGAIWPPLLVEIAPDENEGGTIAWEWHAWDHLVQNVDTNLPNFGEPHEHVDRFDVNYGSASGGGVPGGQTGGDWFHCNAVTYHTEHDLLMLNSRNWNEFYILDHATTSSAASGPAGDLLYRWGNPIAYGRGEASDRMFFGQHDPHWLLTEGPTVAGGDPNQTVLIFNNGDDRPGGNGSSVDELTLPWNPDAQNGHYTSPTAQGTDSFAPEALDWSWPETPDLDFYSSKISGSQRMPNGNTLICEGASGHLFEITPNGDLAWEYYTAYNQFGAINQGDTPFANSTFRAYRYAPDYAAFEGRDMTPGDPVEANPFPFDCTLYPAPVDTTATSIAEEGTTQSWAAYPNPTQGSFRIEAPETGTWTLSDLRGKQWAKGTLTFGKNPCRTHEIPSGMYVLRMYGYDGRPTGASRMQIVR